MPDWLLYIIIGGALGSFGLIFILGCCKVSARSQAIDDFVGEYVKGDCPWPLAVRGREPPDFPVHARTLRMEEQQRVV